MQILIKSGEPSQRPQPGHEAVLAATHGDKLRQAVKSASNGPFGNGEDAIAFTITEDGILLGSVADEIAVGHPLRLHEFELPLLVCANLGVPLTPPPVFTPRIDLL